MVSLPNHEGFANAARLAPHSSPFDKLRVRIGVKQKQKFYTGASDCRRMRPHPPCISTWPTREGRGRS